MRWLRVAEVNDTGAFLDWGRPRDLLLPYGEQAGRVRPGDGVLVYIAEDDQGRPFASMRLNDFIADTSNEPYAPGERVRLVIAAQTDLGVRAVVDDHVWGLIWHEDLLRAVHQGEACEGWVRRVREDGRLDVTLNPPARQAAGALADRILAELGRAGGFLPLSDRSSPDEIRRAFGTSKGVFKQAIGALYRERRILIDDDGIRLPGAR